MTDYTKTESLIKGLAAYDDPQTVERVAAVVNGAKGATMAEIRLITCNHNDLPGRITARLVDFEIEKGVFVPALRLSTGRDTIELWPVPANLKEFSELILAADAKLERRVEERMKLASKALERNSDG